MGPIEDALTDETAQRAVIAGVYLVIANVALATAMFTAYAARVLRKWKTTDE